jgi:GT2 family glycosyltransferase
MSAEPSDPFVTVVVVSWQGRHLIGPCLNSLRRQTLAHRVVVVDNGSTDGTAEFLAADHPGVDVLQTGANLGFAGGVAAGLDVVDTRYVALLNNDAEAEPGWLAALVDCLEAHAEAGAATSRMLLAERPGTLNNTGVLLLPDGRGADRGLGDPDTAWTEGGEVFGFSGGAALLRTAALREVGGFPREFFLYYEDTDVSFRLRLAGWTVRYEPAAVVRHQHSATVDQQSEIFAFSNERNRLLMLLRCAPLGLALRAALRFLLTTASLAGKRLLRRPVPDVPAFRAGLRLRAFGSYLRLTPWALRGRRTIRRRARVSPRDVVATWAAPVAAVAAAGHRDEGDGHRNGRPGAGDDREHP